MTDLNTLFPDTVNIHAFLATPIKQSIGESMADVAPTQPKMTIPANVGSQILRRFGPLAAGR